MNTRAVAGAAVFCSAARIRHILGCLLFTIAVAAISPAQAATDSSTDQPVVQQLLDAMAQNDYQAFVRSGTPEFAQLGEPQFTQVANVVAPRLQQGYTVQYLGDLRQQGLDISVWKVSFKDGGDDLLATLNVNNGKVGGFFLR